MVSDKGACLPIWVLLREKHPAGMKDQGDTRDWGVGSKRKRWSIQIGQRWSGGEGGKKEKCWEKTGKQTELNIYFCCRLINRTEFRKKYIILWSEPTSIHMTSYQFLKSIDCLLCFLKRKTTFLCVTLNNFNLWCIKLHVFIRYFNFFRSKTVFVYFF